jgi:hypothetical protein
MEKHLFFIELATGALILGVLALPLFLGQVYTDDDLGHYHLPIRFFYAQSLAVGDSFAWFPNLLNGFYIHGEGQAGMYHPLHLLLYSTLPLATAFNLELLLSYLCMLVGTFLLIQRWGIQRDAAMFGALVFAFSGFNLLHYLHLNAVAIIAHIPWLLLALDGVMCRPDHRQVVLAKLGVALLTASQLLLGYPQYVWFSSLVEILYLGFLSPSWESGWRVLWLGEAKFLGVLGGSVQLLPTWDVLAHSVRQEPSLMFRYSYSLHPANLVQLGAPYLFKGRVWQGSTHEYGL